MDMLYIFYPFGISFPFALVISNGVSCGMVNIANTLYEKLSFIPDDH